MQLSKTQLAILAIIVTNLIWGAAPPIFKWALEDIEPYTLAFLRFAIPALIIYPFARGHLKIQKKDYINILLIGFFGITINILFFFQGLLLAPSINAALIISSSPLFVILISLIFLRDKPSKKLLTGSLIGLTGVLVVLVTPLFFGLNVKAIGNIFYLFSTLGAIVAIFITRKVVKRNNPIAITFWAFLIGSFGLIPFFLREVNNHGFLQDITIQGTIGLLFGIIFSSLIAYFLQTWSLKYLTAADVSIFVYIDPVITILVAIPLLSEYPTPAFIIGSILILVGIFRAEGRFHYHPFHLFLKK